MGLKESKKFAIGSIHENGGGKFEILDRWYDEATDTIMLKYKFIESDKEEINKEINVTASEWKWRKVRGMAGNTTNYEEGASNSINTNIEECFEGLCLRVEKAGAERRGDNAKILEAVTEQGRMLTELMTIIKLQQKEIDVLINDKDIINKLLEKI